MPQRQRQTCPGQRPPTRPPRWGLLNTRGVVRYPRPSTISTGSTFLSTLPVLQERPRTLLESFSNHLNCSTAIQSFFAVRCLRATVAGGALQSAEDGWKDCLSNFSTKLFLSDGCMAQRGRCPGGRPSVSANKRIHDAYCSVVKWQLYKPSTNTEYDQQSPRGCRYLYWRFQ